MHSCPVGVHSGIQLVVFTLQFNPFCVEVKGIDKFIFVQSSVTFLVVILCYG